MADIQSGYTGIIKPQRAQRTQRENREIIMQDDATGFDMTHRTIKIM